YASSKAGTLLPLPRYHLPLRSVPEIARSSVSSKNGHEGNGAGCCLAPPSIAGRSPGRSAARAALASGAAAKKLRRVGFMAPPQIKVYLTGADGKPAETHASAFRSVSKSVSSL